MDRRRRKRMERWWARAEARARTAVDRLEPESWFDLWHTHLDWDGRGHSPENRRMVNAVAVRVLCYLQARLAHRGTSVQLWADPSPATTNTGIYAHSANPNGSASAATSPRPGLAAATACRRCCGVAGHAARRRCAMPWQSPAYRSVPACAEPSARARRCRHSVRAARQHRRRAGLMRRRAGR